MEHLVCLNTNSFPASSAEQASILFEDSLQGLLALNTDNDRFTLYLDSIRQGETLADFSLADGFTYTNFTDQLHQNQEMDLYLFLLELEDKRPALDHIDNELMDEMTDYDFFMPGYPAPNYPDVLSLAHSLPATLLSINTSKQWESEKLSIARTDDGKYIDEVLTLYNIASYEHGRSLHDHFSYIDIRKTCESAVFTEDLVTWYSEQTRENQNRIIDKCRLACERDFQGGEPLFKPLENGLREIRFSAYPGGAIRILFKHLSENQQAILIGFIKKSNSEGYDENIKRALSLFETCMKNAQSQSTDGA